MENMLRKIDFSRFSKVQASLKQNMMMRYDNRKCILSNDELDAVVAAGAKAPKNKW